MAAKRKSPPPDAEEDGAAQPAGRWSRSRLALVIGVALCLCAGMGTGAYMLLGGKQDVQVAASAPKTPTFYDLPDVLVNLSNAGNERTQYLKMKIVLELADAALVQQIQPVLPRVIDAFQVFLRELRPSDLEGSAGVYRLKEELTRRVNAAIAPNRVNAVLFKEMVVQ